MAEPISLLASASNFLPDWLLVRGYPVLGLALVLGAIGLPVPASLVATMAGGLVAEGELDPLLTVLVALGACLLGDLTGYTIGRLGGRELTHRHGRWLGLDARRLARLEGTFTRSAGPILLLSRSLLAILGSAVNLVAGATRHNLRAFVAYTAAGRLLWVVAFVGLGYAFAGGGQAAADLVSSLSGPLGMAGLALAALLATHRRPSAAVC